MNTGKFTKSQKRELRRLAGLAHERELSVAVGTLEEDFKRWHRGELDVFALNEQIHKYHNGISRELYKQYVMGEPASAVAYGVRCGVLTEKDVTPEIMGCVEGMVKFFEEFTDPRVIAEDKSGEGGAGRDD